MRAEPRPSPIAGTGLFTSAAHAEGEVVLAFDEPPATVEELGRLNHSCDPNLGWQDGTTLIALRAIPEGTELTVDYATVVSVPGWVMWCHCETYRCRQVIEGTDWQIPQLQARYARRFTPAVQARVDAATGAP